MVKAGLGGISSGVLEKRVEHVRLEAGACEEGKSSSGSRERLRRLMFPRPRFAADILGLNGELGEGQRGIDVCELGSGDSRYRREDRVG